MVRHLMKLRPDTPARLALVKYLQMCTCDVEKKKCFEPLCKYSGVMVSYYTVIPSSQFVGKFLYLLKKIFKMHS